MNWSDQDLDIVLDLVGRRVGRVVDEVDDLPEGVLDRFRIGDVEIVELLGSIRHPPSSVHHSFVSPRHRRHPVIRVVGVTASDVPGVVIVDGVGLAAASSVASSSPPHAPPTSASAATITNARLFTVHRSCSRGDAQRVAASTVPSHPATVVGNTDAAGGDQSTLRNNSTVRLNASAECSAS